MLIQNILNVGLRLTDLVAGGTLNSSAANFRTAVKGVASGTERTLNGSLGSDVRVILKVTLDPAAAISFCTDGLKQQCGLFPFFLNISKIDKINFPYQTKHTTRTKHKQDQESQTSQSQRAKIKIKLYIFFKMP